MRMLPTEEQKAIKMSLNLLPPEVLLKKKHSSKLVLINRISAFALIVLIFFTSATLVLRFIQEAKLQQTNRELAFAEEKVNSLKNKEEQIILIKKRLDAIEALLGVDVKKKALFNIIVYLAPPHLQISDAILQKNDTLNLTVNTLSLSALETFIEAVADPKQNLDLVSRIDLDGLSIGKDGMLRTTLKIVPKK